MWLIAAGLCLVYEGLTQLLNDDNKVGEERKLGWLEHNQNQLAKGNPPAELERRIREIAQEEAAKRPAKTS